MENRLPESFKSKGFRFTQMERNNDFALYLKENIVPVESKDYYFCYEVIRIKKQKARTSIMGGVTISYPEKELYPNDNDWGDFGWTFRDSTEARVYFLNLAEKVAPCATAIAKTEDLRLSLSL